MAPIYLRRRHNDGTLTRQIDALQTATLGLAEIASRIARDGGSEVDEDRIRNACNAYDRETHAFKTLLAEMCGFGPDECVDDADEFRGSLVDTYRALIEGRQTREGYVEADVLTPGLMAAE